METKNEIIIARLKSIFDSFLQDNFATTNSVYFEKLITHLAAKENAFVLQATFTLDWVDKVITILKEDGSKIHPKVISFMLNLCGLLTLNEWIVIEIRQRNIMDRLLYIIDRDVHQYSPSMKLGSIRLLSAVSKYSLGLNYIRTTKAWRFLFNYCNQDHTLYVVREARQLLYELLYKFSVKTNDEQIVLEMLDVIIKPMHENVWDDDYTDKITINVDDTELHHKLSSTLDLLSYIFQQTLESEEKTNIAHLCEVHHNLELVIWKLNEMTQNEDFLEKILTALTSFNFAKLVYEKWQVGQIAAENFNKFGLNFFNMMKFCVNRHQFMIFLKLAELNHILWKKLGQRAPIEIQIENERVRFENQLITLHLMPVFFIMRSKEFQDEELFDKYIMKIFEISCEHTMRICYAYRDAVFNAGRFQLVADLAYKSIHGILSMENILERDQAVLVFQALIYALKEFILKSNSVHGPAAADDGNDVKPKAEELIVEIPNVLYAALIALQMLIQRYRITWKESIETICVVNFVMIILKNPNLSTRLAVQALKLCQLSIEHFLSPNMALLVDNLQGSGLVCLGPLIVNRVHDIAWEVRDSTLELVASIANISRLKFPAFQQYLVDHNICSIVYQMAKNDSEPYVRASALKCLTQMVGINVIWEHCLSHLDLIEHLFFVLYNESEGIVRKEAVSTLTKIYDHRKIPSQLKDTLFSTLAHCVVADLYWEVKVKALHFWELEIQKQFTNQGMIDGTFPTVTFSREHKKIVTLTEKEINLRIVKIFNELSQRGCLGVILKCLDDDCDLAVIKMAVCIVYRLLEKLKKYEYESIINSMAGNLNSVQSQALVPPVVELPAEECVAMAEDSEHVIEGIVSAQDINLLISAYETKMHINGEVEKRTIDEEYYKTFSRVTAKNFIATIKSIDMDQLLHNHQQYFLCPESFGSLLDDIIKICAIQPDDETIFADCY